MAVIFLQPPDPAPPTFIATVIDQNAPFPGFGPPGVPRIMADDFALAFTTELSSINFWGYFYLDSFPPAAPTFLPIVHMEIYADIAGSPGPVVWSSTAIGEFGPLGAVPYSEVPLPAPGPGWFYDATAPLGPGNPLAPGTSVPVKYSCPIPPAAIVLPTGVYWVGIQVDLAPTSISTAFGWSNMDPAHPSWPALGPAVFAPTAFGGPGVGPWLPVPYPVSAHPLATAPLDLAFEVEGSPVVTTTTVPPTTTTTTTTAPAGTTTTAPLPSPDWHATWTNGALDPSHVSFGTPMVPPIPADFFYPGSDPFMATVELEGDPIGPEDTSTVLQRDADPFAPGDPPGGPSPVSIEIVALQLRSVSPITVTGGGPSTQWDIFVNLSVVPAPAGVLSATKTHANGGTFSAQFFVQPLFVFNPVAPGPSQELDTGLLPLPPLEFSGSGDWVHSVNDPLVVYAPGAQWVSLIDEVTPGLPSSQVDSPMEAETADGPTPSARHVVCLPRLPTPTTTTGPPFTTPPPEPGTTSHPSDTSANFRISSSEILSYAAAWLANNDLVFPGIPGPNRSAYVLRAAAIFLANFQTRYEDVGTAAPWGSPTHAQRWQALPDL